MSKGYFVRAIYEGKLDKQTEERISDALQRRGAFERNSSGGQPITLTIDGEQQEVFPVTYSDVDWNRWEEDGSEGTEIEVFVDNIERAHHLAHELRFCGMSVQVDREAA